MARRRSSLSTELMAAHQGLLGDSLGDRLSFYNESFRLSMKNKNEDKFSPRNVEGHPRRGTKPLPRWALLTLGRRPEVLA